MELVSFLSLCLLITITPGLDTAVVVRSALRSGRNAGLRTAFGCAAGLFIHAVAVAVGLAELMLRSETAFRMVKGAGVLVLLVLGGRSLWSAWRGHGTSGRSDQSALRGTPLLQGLLTNLTNPKATLFFVATLPQFIPGDRPGQALPIALGLATIAVFFSLAGLGLTAFCVDRMRRVLESRRARRAQDALLGTVLVGLGIRVATE